MLLQILTSETAPAVHDLRRGSQLDPATHGVDTFTVLFPSVEASNRHGEEHPQAMKAALARHDATTPRRHAVRLVGWRRGVVASWRERRRRRSSSSVSTRVVATMTRDTDGASAAWTRGAKEPGADGETSLQIGDGRLKLTDGRCAAESSQSLGLADLALLVLGTGLANIC